jgi:four helix bundle protein
MSKRAIVLAGGVGTRLRPYSIVLPRAAHCRELFDQLDRASLSALLDTAEGNGKRQGRQRARYFDDARGSVIECTACLDAAVAKRFVSPSRTQPVKEMLGREVAMCTRLIECFDTDESRA